MEIIMGLSVIGYIAVGLIRGWELMVRNLKADTNVVTPLVELGLETK